MRRILVLFMAAMLLLAGCSQNKDVDIEEIKIGKVRMVSSQEFDLQFKASVNNPTGTLDSNPLSPISDFTVGFLLNLETVTKFE